jgi:hypothetical protein
LLKHDAALSAGTRFEVRSALSLSAFADALNELPETVEHHQGRYLDGSRSRSLDLSVDGAELDLRMLSVTPLIWTRGAEGRIRVRLDGRAEEADGMTVFRGRLVTRRDWEVTWQDRVAPLAIVIGLIAALALEPLSEVAGAAAVGVAVLGAVFYLSAWGTIRAMRPTRVVEAARLLGTVGAATQGLVTLEPRRVNLALRVLEPVLMDVPGPLVSQTIDRLTAGHAASVTILHGRARSALARTQSVDKAGGADDKPANDVRRPVEATSPDASQATQRGLTAWLARAAVPVLIVAFFVIAGLGPQPGWWTAGSVWYQPRLLLGLAVLGAAGPVTSLVVTPTRARKLILLTVWVAQLAVALALYNEALYKAIAGGSAMLGLLIGLLACWTVMTAGFAAIWAIRTSVRS